MPTNPPFNPDDPLHPRTNAAATAGNGDGDDPLRRRDGGAGDGIEGDEGNPFANLNPDALADGAAAAGGGGFTPAPTAEEAAAERNALLRRQEEERRRQLAQQQQQQQQVLQQQQQQQQQQLQQPPLPLDPLARPPGAAGGIMPGGLNSAGQAGLAAAAELDAASARAAAAAAAAASAALAGVRRRQNVADWEWQDPSESMEVGGAGDVLDRERRPLGGARGGTVSNPLPPASRPPPPAPPISDSNNPVFNAFYAATDDLHRVRDRYSHRFRGPGVEMGFDDAGDQQPPPGHIPGTPFVDMFDDLGGGVAGEAPANPPAVALAAAPAAGPGAAGSLDYMQPVIFSGEIPRPSGEFGLPDFIRAIESRRRRHGYTAAQTVQHALSCLRGRAHNWYEKNLQFHLSPSQLQRVLNDWRVFKALLIKEYDFKNEMRVAVGNRSALRMKEARESDVDYLVRITESYGVIKARHLREIDFYDAHQYMPPNFLLNSASQFTPDQQRRVCAAHGFAMGVERVLDMMLSQFLVEGFDDKKLREWTLKWRGKLPWFAFHQGVQDELRRLYEIQTPQGVKETEDKGPRSFRAMAAAVDAAILAAVDNNEDPYAAAQAAAGQDWDDRVETYVAAVMAYRRTFRGVRSGNRGGRGGARRGGRSSGPPTRVLPPVPAPNQPPPKAAAASGRPRCDYCHMQGHLEATCFKKMAAQGARSSTTANAVDQAGTDFNEPHF